MSIEDPTTYAEWYWKHGVDAQKAIAEDTEKELSAMVAGLSGRLGISDILPDEFAALFSELEAPAGAFLGEVGGRFVSEVADGVVTKTTSPLMESIGYLSYMKWPTKKLTPAATAQLYSRKRITEGFFNERFLMAGFEPIEAQFQYESQMPYPSISDLILYSRYHGDPEAPYGEFQKWFDIPEREWPIWKWLALQRLSTEQVQTLFKRDIFDTGDFYGSLSRIGWDRYDSEYVKELSYLLPNAMLLVQGGLQTELSTETILADISKADIHPDYAQKYLDAVLTKPASVDIVSYELRTDPDLSKLDNRLRKIGIHPDYFPMYKELAYQIPPVADIITMAVREAFTPEIAARFGQYEDFPEPLAEWGLKKGLSKEWTERYWAAHWALPSPQQGFEMLHRGVITTDELNMLLRAQDVMPFWRDKLTAIAYRPLTRVDVRRMFREGVLDETEVYSAYLDAGYADENARRMTEFTIKQTLSSMSKFTTADVLSAFAKFLITSSEARDLLSMLGVRYQDAGYMIATAEYKRQWEITETKIESIRNLYKKAEYTESRARGELLKLDIPTQQVDALMSKWWYEEKAAKVSTFTKAETLRFLKAGTITREQAVSELKAMKYDDWHIGIYLQGIL